MSKYPGWRHMTGVERRNARMHAMFDRALRDLIPCARCGAKVPRCSAVTSEGEGPEQGKTFFYCSEHCEARH